MNSDTLLEWRRFLTFYVCVCDSKMQWVRQQHTTWLSQKVSQKVSARLSSLVLCRLRLLKQTSEPATHESTICCVTGRKASDCHCGCWVSLHSPATRQWWWRPPSSAGRAKQPASLLTPVMLAGRQAKQPSTEQEAKEKIIQPHFHHLLSSHLQFPQFPDTEHCSLLEERCTRETGRATLMQTDMRIGIGERKTWMTLTHILVFS